MPRAINSSAMRSRNEKMILALIHAAPISRADIAKATGLTKAAVSIIVDEWIKRGVIAEGEARPDGTAGRAPVRLTLNKNSVFMVGINISRVDITVGLVNLEGEVQAETVVPILPPKEAMPRIGRARQAILADAQIPADRISQIGLVTPGPVDARQGRILNPPNFDGWQNFPIVEEIRRFSDLDVVFENVSNGTALAEKYFGGAREVSSFLSLQIDEGVGSGILQNNSLFDGLCEVGHISIDPNGIPCACGNCGCLEQYAAIPAVLRGTPYRSWQEAVDAGAEHLFQIEADALKTPIITVNNLFSLDAVVLCGEVSYRPEGLIQALQEKISGKMLSKSPLQVLAGQVRSKTLVAASVATASFFGLSGIKPFTGGTKPAESKDCL